MRERRSFPRAARPWFARGVASLLLVAIVGPSTGASAQPAPPDGPPPLPPPGSTATPPPLPASSSSRPPPPPPPQPAATGSAAPARKVPPPPPPPPPYYYQPAPTPYYPAAPGAVPGLAPGATATEPPAVLPYPDTEAPVPEGYRVDSRPFVGLLGIGIGMLTAGWATTAVAGALASDHAEQNPGSSDPGSWTPLYVPVAGPFITLISLRPGPAETGLLLTGGIIQTAGLLGILVGSLRRTYRLVRTAGPAARGASASAAPLDLTSVQVAPAVSESFLGLTTTGRF